MKRLFNSSSEPFRLHSGDLSRFKIDCDVLSTFDLVALCDYLTEVEALPEFGHAVGVPTGGLHFADTLNQRFAKKGSVLTLVVDDVLTTGRSMEEVASTISGPVQGLVIFSRGECPSWVTPIFSLNSGDLTPTIFCDAFA